MRTSRHHHISTRHGSAWSRLSSGARLLLFGALLVSSTASAQLKVGDVDKSWQDAPLVPEVEEGYTLKAYMIYFDCCDEALELNRRNRVLIEQLLELTGLDEAALLKCMKEGDASPLWTGKDKELLLKYGTILNDAGAYYGVRTLSTLDDGTPDPEASITKQINEFDLPNLPRLLLRFTNELLAANRVAMDDISSRCIEFDHRTLYLNENVMLTLPDDADFIRDLENMVLVHERQNYHLATLMLEGESMVLTFATEHEALSGMLILVNVHCENGLWRVTTITEADT